MVNVPREINGVYKFECGEETYTYRTSNKRVYTNQEFINIFKISFANYMYYKEPCTMWNDPDGWLVHFPRIEEQDKGFLRNVKIILENTKNQQKKQLINKILNDCFIVDEEPVLHDGIKLDDPEITFLDAKEFGEYHIDQYKLNKIYRDAINFSVHKYIKKYSKSHYNKNEEENMNLLLNED